MDFVTIGGLVGAFAVVLLGIITSGDIMNFWDAASVFIVVGGAILAAVASFPLPQTLGALKAAGIAFKKVNFDMSKEIELIISIANVARREGLLALEEQANKTDDPFVKKGIGLIVDGTDPELIKGILETELDYMSERHSNAQAVFEQLAAFSPAFGMLGTLVGLINMLVNLSDVAALGPQMSVALITTFYGVILANMIFTPIARKLKYVSAKEYLRKVILLEGLLSIQDGVNPRIIRDKLDSFISRSENAAASSAKKGAAETQEIGQ